MLTSFLADHWLTAALAGYALVLAALFAWLRRPALIVCAAALLAFAAGEVILPASVGRWVALGAFAILLAMLAVVVFTTHWSAPLGWAVAALLLFGVGGSAHGISLLVRRFVDTVLNLDLADPWWLLLLVALVPLTVVSWPGLRFFLPYREPGAVRYRIAFGLCVVAVALVALALADPRIGTPHDHTTVLFVLDRSISAEERDHDMVDRRWQRLRKFMNEAVQKRPADRRRDQVGLIVFGRKPRLELLPGDAPRFNLTEITSQVDGSATDIAAALQLAMASFPPGSAKRIVLMSDGNENRGSAGPLADAARAAGVQIDVVPLGAGKRQENEVLVERIEAPVQVGQGEPLPMKVWVRSFSRKPVSGLLKVRQISEKGDEVLLDREVTLELGLNPFPVRVPPSRADESYTYEAEFQPRALAGDRPQNNKAATHVIARGRRRVLLLEAEEGRHQKLFDALRAAGPTRFEVSRRTIEFLDRFADPEQLAAWLGQFDSVLLCNIPADKVTPAQQEALRANTHNLGSGLVVVGGPESYGAGGWQNTPVEQALPVDCDIKGIETDDKAGLVLIMHASEMAEGNMWQKKIAKLAIERLSPRDHVGVLQFGWNDSSWHIPMQEVGEDRGRLLRLVDRLEPGDMPDFDPHLKLAHEALTDKKRNLSLRHVIIISDGDPNVTLPPDPGSILPRMKKDRVSVTTVGVSTHGVFEDQKMQTIADITRSKDGKRGFYYKVTKASDLPAIYIKETRLVSQSFVHEQPFEPIVRFRTGPTAGLPERVPNLRGFVRTTKKESRLVEIPIKTPEILQQDFPLLASWTYGLGKAVAFTSDAGDPKFWSRDWAAPPSTLYGKFWEQVVGWSMRPTESKNLTLTADYRDGRIRIVVDARTDADPRTNTDEPDVDLRDLRAEVTTPRAGVAVPKVKFQQKSPGVYEGEIPAEEAGSYFIGFQATRKTTVDGKEVEQRVSLPGSVTVPYAAEFADLESNPDLLESLRYETGGESYPDDLEELLRVARAGTVFRPGLAGSDNQKAIWPWLLFVAAILLLIDVALRRLALERLGIASALVALWGRLRGRGVAAPATTTLDRLQSRKARVSEQLASRRFEPTDRPPPPAPPGPSGPRPTTPAPPTAQPPSQPPAPGEADDYLSRLKRRKKKVWEDRGEEPRP